MEKGKTWVLFNIFLCSIDILKTDDALQIEIDNEMVIDSSRLLHAEFDQMATACFLAAWFHPRKKTQLRTERTSRIT